MRRIARIPFLERVQGALRAQISEEGLPLRGLRLSQDDLACGQPEQIGVVRAYIRER